ncbi:TPA: tRNA (guanosine(37)-N1)-methyltransferase TrmD [Candidatus Peribacteria bacterium]|nr:MAG: tRNA (guanosine(37)-N1)-methyltransferase TrmD [Candidatus Peribacteria bacterium RIFOXYC2_FULL_58_10]OGJ85321.1 MAG: tRNA (guanosine(37)-N1)-methyltransferase TrmD [Candidatus Peribacteria bacterium RIFOXYD2_FULL_58_15]HAI98234.1 tRNA (guanosine(37)-N1)-methyltransferase TrmD [Candidatus Peribacteria bacterium]HAS34484.1 tRNA (guanosine(37)-N1)-methyltransferase TrmD [Candidatus Peribacteria bacterium]
MRIDILTLFPGMFSGPLTESILKRAQEEKLLTIRFHDLRTFGLGRYHQVDDRPYGGGAGMVMRSDVVVAALEAVVREGNKRKRSKRNGKPWTIYLSPRGKKLTQIRVEQLAKKHEWLILLCGHYEGIDQRIISGGWIDEEISIGDYVLTGGEIPAMVLIDAVARQIPGVLGKDASAEEESFSKSLKRKREYPHYTRPEVFRKQRVPKVLLNGNHREIKEWREDHLS